MILRAPWSKKLTRRIVAAGMVIVALIVAACIFFRIARPRDIFAYRGMAAECHPVWSEFAWRRFGVGDSASELVRRFPTSNREEFGPYAVYSYYRSDFYGEGKAGKHYTGFTVVAKDGRLIAARSHSCTWSFAFFDITAPSFYSQYAAVVQERNERQWRERVEMAK